MEKVEMWVRQKVEKEKKKITWRERSRTRISKVKWTAGVKNEDPNIVSIYADDTAIFTESNNTQIKSQNSCSHRRITDILSRDVVTWRPKKKMHWPISIFSNPCSITLFRYSDYKKVSCSWARSVGSRRENKNLLTAHLSCNKIMSSHLNEHSGIFGSEHEHLLCVGISTKGRLLLEKPRP